MSLNIRRVVTGHDDQGRAKVLIDEQVKNVIRRAPAPHYSVIWSTDGFPVNNDGARPFGKKYRHHDLDNGTVFRIVSFGPGVSPRNHRTNSIDYAVVMSGEIDMDLDGDDRAPESRRCAGAARHDSQLDQQGLSALRDRVHAHFGEAGERRGKLLPAQG